MREFAIEIIDVTKNYKKNKNILTNIILALEYGKTYFLYGQTGSGKTSLLKIISGENKPSQGDVFVFW